MTFPVVLFLIAAPLPEREGVDVELRADRNYSRITFHQKGEEYVVACRVNYTARAAGRTVRAWVQDPGTKAWYEMQTEAGAAFKPRAGSGVVVFRFEVPWLTAWGEEIDQGREGARVYVEMSDAAGVFSSCDEELWLWDR